jgi:hypothetical protein
MVLQLPDQLRLTLRRDARLAASVDLSLTAFEPWIADNKLVFFPEYTDHGLDHLNAVLRAADALICDESWSILTPSDAAVLVLAVLVHDSAMHLHEEGFQRLVTDATRAPLPVFQDIPWPELWDDFLREASRFDSNRLNAVLGHDRPVKFISLDKAQLTRDHRLMIGEFLRRHHGRLAHEICHWGVPGPDANPLTFVDGVSPHIRDLSGLVARSHNIPIRDAVEALPIHERQESEGVHGPFLMAVLRIADFLRVEHERAPTTLLKVMSIQSPVSRGEWNTHHAIRHVSMIDADPEAVRIKAEPADVGTFLRLKALFAAIQHELDESWAVLGEVYGRFKELHALALTLRRVRSNLDDTKAFARTVGYVPAHAAFVAAGSELLKLLVGPLYANEPAIGVRELLQNAVDACLELEAYRKNHQVAEPQLTDQEADVVIRLERAGDDVGWLTVSDRGIGMNADILRNYFLRAGASFRLAKAWRDEFENKDGHSKVLRSGRFGIGALAAFLLGDVVEVTTRRVGEERGIRFDGRIDSPHLQLEWHDRPVGTTVRVQIDDSRILTLLENEPEKWDWYCLRKPSVVRYRPDGQRLEQRCRLPQPFASLPINYRRIKVDNFDDVIWALNEPHLPPIACNGIVVSAPERVFFPSSLRPLSINGISFFKTPPISVFDSDANLPLSLQRTGVVGELPFRRELFEDVGRDFLAYLLVRAPTHRGQTLTPSPADDLARYSLLSVDFSSRIWLPYWYTSEGVSVTHSWHIAGAHPRRLLLVVSKRGRQLRCIGSTPAAMLTFVVPDDLESSSSERSEAQDEIIRLFCGKDVTGTPLGLLKPSRIRVCARKYSDWSLASISGGTRGERDGWTILQLGDWSQAGLEPAPISSELENEADFFAEWDLPVRPATVLKPKSELARLWHRILAHPVIPYSEKRRRERFARAYEVLKPYIKRHEELAQRD